MKTIKFVPALAGYYEDFGKGRPRTARMYFCFSEFHWQFPDFARGELEPGFTMEIYNRPGKGRKRFTVRKAEDNEFCFAKACAVINSAGDRLGADVSLLLYVKRHRLNVLYVKIIPNKIPR